MNEPVSRGRVLVLAISGALIAMSMAVITLFVVTRGTERLPAQLVRFSLTCALAYGLTRGLRWLRWIAVVVLAGTGAFAAVAGLANLAEGRGGAGTWFVLLGTVYLLSSCLLAVHPSIQAFFRATHDGGASGPKGS